MMIHIGCGKRDFGPEWFNVDGADFPHIHSNDITLSSLHSNSASLIYACHFLEYFDRVEGLKLLQKWHRVLKPGGTIRLAVPDWDAIVAAVNHRFKLDDILGPLYGRMEMNGKIIYHKTVYNFHHLKDILLAAGYNHVQRYNWNHTIHGIYDDHSQSYLPKMDKTNGMLISLNVEAKKDE